MLVNWANNRYTGKTLILFKQEEKLLDSFSFDWNVVLEIPPYIERPTPIVACLTCDVPGA